MISKPEEIYSTTSSRDDYVRFSKDYEYWLFNPQWQIKPSVAMCSEGVYILTCRDHDKGTKKNMIHLPRQPLHILPAQFSDQLSCNNETKNNKTHESMQIFQFISNA